MFAAVLSCWNCQWIKVRIYNMPCSMAHLGYLGWREGRGSELIKSGFLPWSVLQAETVSHMLSPHIYPFQSIGMQMSTTMCLNKCLRDRKYLLEMSLQFLSKIRHLCSPLHEPSSSFSSHIGSDTLRLWARSWATAQRCAVTLGPLRGLLLREGQSVLQAAQCGNSVSFL